MKTNVFTSLMILMLLMASCINSVVGLKVSVTNQTDLNRSTEIVSIPVSELNMLDVSKPIVAEDLDSKTLYASQLSPGNKDGKPINLLFQPEVAANSSKELLIRNIKEGETAPDTSLYCYSRFVPERIDDYAWENDRVAFRTYGPEAQRISESGKPGGTLSSGIDCWLKKVNYPIINKWYQKHVDGGTYHEDSGEGLDNYHVGSSRGSGGTMVFDKETDAMYAAKNYVDWEKIEDGNLRAGFKLYYAPYKAGEKTVTEVKYISVDKGSNLARFEINVDGSDVLTAGITLHNKGGEIMADEKAGWFNYYDPNYFQSELNNAIVADPKYITGYDEYIVDEADQSHILVHLKAIDGKVVFYSGFFWKESQQFESNEAWLDYLNDFAIQLKSPLSITIE